MATRSAPAPGQAPLPARNAAALLRRNGTDPAIAPRPAVRFGDEMWSHGDSLRQACRFANLFLSRRPAAAPFHVGLLLENVPEYLFAFGGAALAGATVVGLNATRRGEALRRDLTHTDVSLLITEPALAPLLEPLAGTLPETLVAGETLADAVGAVDDADPGLEPAVSTTWALIFTSGTTSAPKAVVCSQRRLLVTGNRMATLLGLGPEDVGYVCMPLFHSNAVMVGWAPSLVAGASVGLARRFSASAWLDDVRRYGATWFGYTGKPLSYLVATPERPDDADNPLRIAFGNEGSPQVVATFARRFGVEVVDAFGATEGGIAVDRTPPLPEGAVGRAGSTVLVVDEGGNERPRARYDADGRLANADECVGEIVNTAGAGPFEGYYNNPEATARATRRGWYWSGDLGYVDGDGFLFFAGRSADWIRVDGENFPAGPVEAAVSRHPDVVVASAYGVPDEAAGDQVMVALVLRPGASFDPAAFAAWIDELADLAPKWRPRYVRVADQLPTTGTNKVVVRALARQKFRRDLVGGDEVVFRPRGEPAYRRFTEEDEAALRRAFAAAGRDRFWDL